MMNVFKVIALVLLSAPASPQSHIRHEHFVIGKRFQDLLEYHDELSRVYCRANPRAEPPRDYIHYLMIFREQRVSFHYSPSNTNRYYMNTGLSNCQVWVVKGTDGKPPTRRNQNESK